MLANTLLGLAWELALFAGAVGLLFAIDDLAVDALWLAGIGNRPKPLPTVMLDRKALRYAVLVPAWRESEVLGTMLSVMAQRWPMNRVRVYVGVYPNDFATIAAVADLVPQAPWLQLVILDRPGPTTKGDCLNSLWQRLADDRQHSRWLADAVLIHDAEDVVDAHELTAHDDALMTADYSQIPVAPLMHPQGRWISGHYVDEFAEAHLKELAVREAVGAILPTAGVGCAVRVATLDRIAAVEGPFASGSLTEDYELGLKLAAVGARGTLALCTDPDGQLIATRAYFPRRFGDAVRQKTRWMLGIALDGWDRMGWPQRPAADEWDRIATAWMLWRDRRTMLAAWALAAGYASLVLAAVANLLAPGAASPYLADETLRLLAMLMTIIMAWRLLMRCLFTARAQGWRQGVLAVPRLIISNMVLIACSWRALTAYIAVRRGAARVWDKTEHEIPAAPALVAYP
jgi:bacteriophage N4 adsorption protein B